MENSIHIPYPFEVLSQAPIDVRLVLSKAEMKAVVSARMPDVYVAVCTDDGNLYVYNKENTKDDETGKFRLYKSATPISDEYIHSLFGSEGY